MKVEAFKQGNGLFIPMNELLEKIPAERVVLNIEFLEPLHVGGYDAGGYDALDQLLGLCETGIADASAHHDSCTAKKRVPVLFRGGIR